MPNWGEETILFPVAIGRSKGSSAADATPCAALERPLARGAPAPTHQPSVISHHVGVLKQEVRRVLLVFLAGKVGLYADGPVKPHSLQAVNGLLVLWGDGDSLWDYETKEKKSGKEISFPSGLPPIACQPATQTNPSLIKASPASEAHSSPTWNTSQPHAAAHPQPPGHSYAPLA